MWTSRQLGETALWTSELLSVEPGLAHGFTGAGANMSATQGPAMGGALSWRRAVCEHLGLDIERLTLGQQVHGGEVVLVGEGPAVAGLAPAGGRVPHVDGLVTDMASVPLMALSADCPAIVVYQPRGTEQAKRGGVCVQRAVLGVAHAGWRGAVAGIATRLVDVMVERCGCDRGVLLAAMAPSAGPCCYEVKDDVLRVAAARWPQCELYFVRRHGRTYLDLWSVLSAQLAAAGIDPSRQSIARRCSICDERFFSFRRDGATTGHAALIAGIRP